MWKSWVKKGLICGIIVLFIGTSVLPSIGGNLGEITKSDSNSLLIKFLMKKTNFDNDLNSPKTLGLTDGLVGYWSFNDGTAHDNSGNGHDGTKYGTTYYPSGGPDESGYLTFNGNNDYINVGQYTQFGGTQSFSLCAWIKKTIYQIGEPSILNNMYSSASGITLFSNGNRQAVMVGGIDGTNNQAPVFDHTNVMDNKWHFLVGTYDGAVIRLYYEGSPVASRNDFSFYTSSSQNMNIGRMESGNRMYFNGAIDEVRIYNRALSAGEIQNLYNNPGGNHNPNTPNKPSGPTSGNTGVSYTYQTSTTDPDGDQVYYNWSWGDDTYSGWIGPYSSGATATMSHKWTTKGSYSIKVKAKDVYAVESDWSPILPVTITSENQPPEKPKIIGQTSSYEIGKTAVIFAYSFDPDDDKISYLVDWGDNSQSEWSEYMPGCPVFEHMYSRIDTFNIQVKAKDEHELESEWSDIKVVNVIYTGLYPDAIKTSACWETSGGYGKIDGASLSVEYCNWDWAEHENEWIYTFHVVLLRSQDWRWFDPWRQRRDAKYFYIDARSSDNCGVFTSQNFRFGGVNVQNQIANKNPPLENLIKTLASSAFDRLTGIGIMTGISIVDDLVKAFYDTKGQESHLLTWTQKDIYQPNSACYAEVKTVVVPTDSLDDWWTVTFDAGVNYGGGWLDPSEIGLDIGDKNTRVITFSGPVFPAPPNNKVPEGTIIYVKCPVDVVVYTPNYGFVISKNLSTMDGATYTEKDLDGDGDLDKEIYIPRSWYGNYSIYVKPQPGADPDETFSIDVISEEETIHLIKDMKISEINATTPFVYSKPEPSWGPYINGETDGKAGKEYEYTLNSTTPYDIGVYEYLIDWGDNSSNQLLTGPYNESETVTVTHKWNETGTYTVKVKAKDRLGSVSDWATLTVTMPCNTIVNTPFMQFLHNFIQSHPSLFPILQKILQRLGLHE